MKFETLPRITVVTVTHNAEAFIEATLKGVASQNYTNLEYIIIDGKSSDQTCSIIHKHAHCITQFISEKDYGIYNAMNKGIRLASPESRFITFLNAGDVFHDSNVINRIMSCATSTHSHLYGNISKAGQIVHTPEELNQYVLSTNMVCHQAIFFQTSVHRNYLYDTRFKLCADYKLLIDLVLAGEQFCKINTTVVDFDMTGETHQHRTRLHAEKRAIRRMYPTIFFYHLFKQGLRPVRQHLSSKLHTRIL